MTKEKKDHNREPITGEQVKAINEVAKSIAKGDQSADTAANRKINNFVAKVRKEMRRGGYRV